MLEEMDLGDMGPSPAPTPQPSTVWSRGAHGHGHAHDADHDANDSAEDEGTTPPPPPCSLPSVPLDSTLHQDLVGSAVGVVSLKQSLSSLVQSHQCAQCAQW
jgi:hypothetical protein